MDIILQNNQKKQNSVNLNKSNNETKPKSKNKKKRQSKALNNSFHTDPKYKTEICNKWEQSGTCTYGKKCRFAHGKAELFRKSIDNYKQKDCLSFHSLGYCVYGNRCNFKHDERKIENIERESYYSFKLETMTISSLMFNKPNQKNKRLQIFKEITSGNEGNNFFETSDDNKNNDVFFQLNCNKLLMMRAYYFNRTMIKGVL